LDSSPGRAKEPPGMRVAIVQEHVDVRRGGAETSTIEMARHLPALGLDVTVVCAGRHEGNEARRHEALAFRFIDVDGGSRVARTRRFVAEADRVCQQASFDVVHAVTPCRWCDVYQPRGGTYVETVTRSVARAAGPVERLIKRVGRRFNRRQRFLLRTERELLGRREPPFVAAVSQYVARQVKAAFPRYPVERLRIVFNGVDVTPLSTPEAHTSRVAVRRELGIEARAPLVLFVGHNFKLKGLRELIGALGIAVGSARSPALERVGHPRVRRPPAGRQSPTVERTGHPGELARAMPGSDWTLVVAGRDNAAPYRRLARRLGVAGRIRFLGSRSDIRSLYAAADVLAHPTWYDPCSRVVLEALSCGLPVVTTRFNGAAEVIEQGRHGAVIDSPRDARVLAAAIGTCLTPEVREACRAEAAQMQARLSMVRHARDLKALYDEVVGSRG
jgi:UDP-glucose:(heptosyl)LPS alpha-1,3-glucosyltransferase